MAEGTENNQLLLDVKDLKKHFKVPIARRGLLGTVVDLFARQHQIVRAVDGINFEIYPGCWSDISALTELGNLRL